MSLRGIFRHSCFVVSFVVAALAWDAGAQSDWRVRSEPKRERDVRTESESRQSIERSRVTIRQTSTLKPEPRVFREEMEWEFARRIKLDEQTAELIRKLETMKRDPRQAPRMGEINMRLAEYYYERAKITAAKEAASWERQLKAWEDLPEARKHSTPRPVLRTPEANRERQAALKLYIELEGMSRGADRGRSQMIQRDEVLFYLASTLVEVGRGKEAIPHFEEMLSQSPTSDRSFSARLQLADLYFETGQFAKATPHYLQLATGRGAPPEGQHLRAYALYKLGWCYLNTNQADKAVLSFRRTLDASRDNPSERRIVFEREAKNDLMRAYAMAGQYEQGERFFKDLGDENLQREYYVKIAETARDKGDNAVAERYYLVLAEKYPNDPGAREWAQSRVGLVQKLNRPALHAKALEDFVRQFGEGSKWLRGQDLSEDERKGYADDAVAALRREAKNRHSLAQRKQKSDADFLAAEPFYASYFRVVPEPASDTPENLHEMRFFYAELLYRLKRFPEAAEQYAKVGAGKHGSEAAYNRILALREAVKKDKKLNDQLAAATESFISQNPDDARATDLLYAGAAHAYDSGSEEKALEILRRIVKQTPDKNAGIEAAERILFIHEKKKDFDAGAKDADAFLANEALLKTGGADFRKRVTEYRDRARFSVVDAIPESKSAEKGRAYLELSQGVSGEIKEKALNNAIVFSTKAGDSATAAAARDEMLKHFPNSSFAGGIYLERADKALAEGSWNAALNDYRAFIQSQNRKGAAKSADIEAATWNSLYVRAHLEDIYPFRTYPTKGLSAGLRSELFAFIQSFPAAKSRSEAVAILSYHKDATAADLNKLKALPRASSEERKSIAEAEALLAARLGAKAERASLLKRFPPSPSVPEILRPALAELAFNAAEAAYDAYQKGRINTKSDKLFVSSLNARVTELQKLEKEILKGATYGDGEIALKTYERLARLYKTLARDIEQAPQLKQAEVKEFLDPQIKSLIDKSQGFVRTCLEKAVEFKISGAGLEACRTAAREFDASLVPLQEEIVPTPRWISAGGAENVRPVLRVAREAFAQNRSGEFLLAVAISERDKTPLTELERAEIDNMLGLVNVRFGRLEAATRSFRGVSDRQGPALGSVRTAALKNLAALYLMVGDYRSASETAGLLAESDSDVAWIRGVAEKALGRVDAAVKAYQSGLVGAKDPSNLLFNLALAQAATGRTPEAATTMQQYIERASPPSSHPSRQLYRAWRSQQP